MADAPGVMAEDFGLRNDRARVFDDGPFGNARDGAVAVQCEAMTLRTPSLVSASCSAVRTFTGQSPTTG